MLRYNRQFMKPSGKKNNYRNFKIKMNKDKMMNTLPLV